MLDGDIDMFYYRYRSGSELAIKELIYDELYFASKDECNDPYEGKIFAKLDADEELWCGIISEALSHNSSEVLSYLVSRIVAFFVHKSPIYIDEVLDVLATDLECLGENDMEKRILKNVSTDISKYILLHLPPEQYFASFSRSCDNYLLWSHYANNHKGFCLIFRTENGKLKQNKASRKEYVPLSVKDYSIPDLLQVYVPQEFEFRNVQYTNTPESVNGAEFFPRGERIYGGDEENKVLMEKYIYTYLQKHSVWDYEEETRVVLSTGFPLITGRKVIIPSYHRLFHYDSTQLVGIVLGANMPMEMRRRIKDIICEKVLRWDNKSSDIKSTRGFVIYEEQFSASERKVQSNPVAIYLGKDSFDANHPDFQSLLDEWKSV